MATSETQVHIFTDVVQAKVSSNCIDAQISTETVTQSILGIPGPAGSPGSPGLQGAQGAAGSGSSDNLSDTDGDTIITVEAGADEDKIRFDTAGTERMIIDESGNVGIGRNPSQKLHVDGFVQITEGNRLQFTHSGFRNGQVYMNGTDMFLNTDTGGTAIKFFVDGAFIGKFDVTGLSFGSGNRVLGTAGQSDTLEVRGNGGLSIASSRGGGSGNISFTQFASEVVTIDTTGNLGIGTSDQFGGGEGVIALSNAPATPGSNPAGGGILYVESGALKYRGSSGMVTTIAPA